MWASLVREAVIIRSCAPTTADQFRYSAVVSSAVDQGAVTKVDATTMALMEHEPIGVVGQISTVEFPADDRIMEISSRSRSGRLRGLSPHPAHL